jgi:hypothetical protein
MSYLVKMEEITRKMYSEIVKHDLSLSLSFDPGKDAWIIKLVK